MNVARFRRLVRAVLLSAGPASAVACSSSDPTEMPERAQCINPYANERYAALTVGPNIDGIAFANRPTSGEIVPSGEVVVTTNRLPSIGAPCSGAKDQRDCAYRVAALLNDSQSTGWELTTRIPCFTTCTLPSTDLAVITTGDDVRLATFEDVFASIAPIETRDEAAAVLLLRSGDLDCTINNARPDGDGWTFKKTHEYCDGEVSEEFARVGRDGKVTPAGANTVEEGDDSCIEGRRPANLAKNESSARWLSSLATCFAEIAHMESAAVLAFDELDRQLAALDAPWELRMRAYRARADEVAHAAITSELARQFGGRVRAPVVAGTRDPSAPDALLHLALQNAIEGCVREAYGALVAAHQAAHASDPRVRAAFAQIAVDEADHAELSFALDAWLMTRLPPRDRARVAKAKEQAWRDLAAAVNVEPAPEVVRVAGMPTAATARALLAQLAFTFADRAAA